jgi:hypothetical protein
MTKKAIITIHLGQEAENENNEVIETKILKAISAISIPHCSKIENVEIEELEAVDIVDKLKEHGLSKTAVDNIIVFYRGEDACLRLVKTWLKEQ